ncbi:MAG: hypothetical protein ACTTJ6_01820 [Treponema sp.]
MFTENIKLVDEKVDDEEIIEDFNKHINGKMIDTFPVIELEDTAFRRTHVVSVVIPDTVILIRDVDGYLNDGCFADCKSLKKVSFRHFASKQWLKIFKDINNPFRILAIS